MRRGNTVAQVRRAYPLARKALVVFGELSNSGPYGATTLAAAAHDFEDLPPRPATPGARRCRRKCLRSFPEGFVMRHIGHGSGTIRRTRIESGTVY